MNLKHQHHVDFGRRDKVIHRTYHPLLDGEFFHMDFVCLSLTILLQGLHAI